nr:hypothetical protein [Tanacetum cinerariifolium]
ENVGSSFPRVILIGSISIEVPVALEVEAAAVASPARVLELDTHSSLEADPSKSSPPPVSIAPMVSPFLCSGDSESDTKMPETHVLPTPHDAMLTRWRSEVASRSSSPTTSTLEISTAPILPVPYAIVSPSSEFPLKPVVSPHGIPLRYTSYHLDRFTFGSSSGHSSSDRSSFWHFILGHSLSGHASPDTTIADSSTPPRFVYPPLSRTPQCSKVYLCWGSTPLSTMYPSTTSESSVGILLPSHLLDHLVRDDSVEDDIDVDELADVEADATAVKVAVDRDVEAGVDAGIGIEVDVGINVEERLRMRSIEEGLQDIYKHVIEIPLQRIKDIKTGQRELEARSLIAGGEKASLLDQNMTITRSGMTPEAIEELVNQKVEEALATYEATRKTAMTAIMEMVEMEIEEMEMVKMEMVEMEIQMRMIGLLGLLLESLPILLEVSTTQLQRNKKSCQVDKRFQELTMMCTKMVPKEEDWVEKFIRGLPDNIQGNVIAAEPTRLQDVVRIANNLMDQKLKGYATKKAENKKRLEVNHRDNRGQPPPFKRQNVGGQNVARSYTAGPCTVKCGKYNKVGHMAIDCKNAVVVPTTQGVLVVNQRVLTCFEWGRQGYYRNE